MSEQVKDLEEIILLCKKHGLESFKHGNLKFKFHVGDGGDGGMPFSEKMKLKFPDTDLSMPEDDDMLGYSTPLQILEEPKHKENA